MHRQVKDAWTRYSAGQKVFDSFENEWDCCSLFGDEDSDNNNDNNNKFHASKAPILTASNVIPQKNGIASTSTLPLPHEESSSMDLDAQFLPHHLPVSTASVISENAIASTSVHPPVHKESISSNILPLGTPMNLDMPLLLPSSPRKLAPVSLMLSYDDCPPRISPSHDSDYFDCSHHDTRPYGHQHNPRRNSPEQYVSCCHCSWDDGPSHLHRRDSRDDSPRCQSLSPHHCSRGPYQSTPNIMVTSHPPPDTRIVFDSGSVVYHHFGFYLDEIPYTGVTSSASMVKFYDWVDVLWSIGCHWLNSSEMHRQPIWNFLECLLSTDDPLCNIPTKFWDLNARNSMCLDLATGLVRIEPKTFLDGRMLYLIHPVDMTRDSSWVCHDHLGMHMSAFRTSHHRHCRISHHPRHTFLNNTTYDINPQSMHSSLYQIFWACCLVYYGWDSCPSCSRDHPDQCHFT